MKRLRMTAAALTVSLMLSACGNGAAAASGWKAEYGAEKYRSGEAGLEETASEKKPERDGALIAVLDFGSRENTYKVVVEPFTKDAMQASFGILGKEIKRLMEGWIRYGELLHH